MNDIKKPRDWLRNDEIQLETMNYTNTNELLHTIALMKNTRVTFLIDDLNDKYGTSFRYNDYLRNRPLPPELKDACRTMHKTLGREQEKIIEDCRKRSLQIFPFFGKVLLALLLIGMVITLFD